MSARPSWHTVVCPDLRRYGKSSKPPTTSDHEPYSKRAMARIGCMAGGTGYGPATAERDRFKGLAPTSRSTRQC